MDRRAELGPPAIDPERMEPEIGADIEVVARRELAVRALHAMSDLLDVDVSVPNLLELAREPEPSNVRLQAKRMLRCLQDVGRENSAAIRRVGVDNVYHYVEGVVTYGANNDKYLELMDEYHLSAEEVTGLYAFRELVSDETDGRSIGFPTLIRMLRSLGIGPRQAAQDPEETVATLMEAGYIVDHLGGKIFDRPRLIGSVAGEVALGYDRDTPRDAKAAEGLEWVRRQFWDVSKEEPEIEED